MRRTRAVPAQSKRLITDWSSTFLALAFPSRGSYCLKTGNQTTRAEFQATLALTPSFPGLSYILCFRPMHTLIHMYLATPH